MITIASLQTFMAPNYGMVFLNHFVGYACNRPELNMSNLTSAHGLLQTLFYCAAIYRLKTMFYCAAIYRLVK